MEQTATPAGISEGRLDIRLFGHAELSVSGAPVKFSKRSTTLAMIAFLVLRRGHAIPRESLAFLLFPESDETAALAELRRYLYLAAKALPERDGEPWLIVDGDTVRWNDDAGAFVDVLAFERAAGDARTHAQAIELYAGDLLEDVYDDWVLGERERLRSKYLTILAESIDRHRANREFAPAIACAKRLLATDPWREDAIRSLVAIRYESGDTAGALSEYERFAKRLRDDLAIAPMAETVAVRQSILRNEALPGSFERPARAAAAESKPSNSPLPFVGRERELEALRGAWARAARGAGSLVTIVGEAGVGKTRLSAELARIAQAEGGRVFVGTTASPESTPYQAIVEALHSAVPLILTRPPAPAKRAILARLLPELRDTDAAPDPADARATERDASLVFDALAHTVRGLASPRPLLLVLEDLQWAGLAGIDALAAIVRGIARAPVLVVVTCREEETPAHHPLRLMQRSLQSFANVEEIALERLAASDVAELATKVETLREREDREAIVRDLYAHSEGNALFLNEAIVALDRDGSHGAAPTTVAGIVAARVGRLGEHARTAAEIAAVAGAGCSVSLIRDVSNLSAASVASGLDELLDRRLLREAGARAKHDYVFTHHLIADAVYDEIEPTFRAQRHARIARVLEATYRDADRSSSREIARHYERAGDDERSSTWYLTAARESASVYAFGDAVSLATRGLERSPADDGVRAALLALRENAYGRRGERDAQRADIDELERVVGSGAPATFDILSRRVLLSRALGEADEEGRLIDAMTVVAENLGDDERARALVHRATHAGLRSRQSEGIVPARAALAMYDGLGDVRGQLECLFLLVDFLTNVGDLPASRVCLEEIHRRAGSVADRAIEARALAVASLSALLRQEYRESLDLSERALALQLATGDREGEAATRGRLAATAVRLDDFTRALREFDLALEAYEAMGHRRGLGTTYTNRAMMLVRLGLFDEALHSIERSNEAFETNRETRTIVANLVNASFVRLVLGDAAAAKALAQSALSYAKEIGFPAFEAAALANLGNAERGLADFGPAIEHMLAGLAIRRAIQEPRDFVDDLADLAIAFADAGRIADALATAAELRDIGSDSFDAAFWPHYPWWAIARAYAAAGMDEEANSAYASARNEVDRFAAKIDDPRVREAFLATPVTRLIASTRA